MAYNSSYTGAQIDAAVGAVRQKESVWDAKAPGSLTNTVVDLSGTVNGHVSNGNIHVTSAEKSKWDGYGSGTVRKLSYNYTSYNTSHNLTGLSDISGIIPCTFRPTWSFHAGDTIRIDGTAYSIQLSNGEEAGDNLFVSGAAVSVIVDKDYQRVNFKAAGGGAKLPAGTTVSLGLYMESTDFIVPFTGNYTITVIGKGGNGGKGRFEEENAVTNNWYTGGSGGAAGAARGTFALKAGESYPITVSAAQCSFGSLISAAAGSSASLNAAGTGGISAGGNVWQITGSNGNEGFYQSYYDPEPDELVGADGVAYTEDDKFLCKTAPAGGKYEEDGKTPSELGAAGYPPFGVSGSGGGGTNSKYISPAGGTGFSGMVYIEVSA